MGRLIEWIGQPALLSDPVVRYRLATGAYTEQMARVVREAARKRVVRVDGHTARVLTPMSLPGLSRSYKWGPEPGSFVQPVADADLILGCIDGREFVDVSDGPHKRPAIDAPGETQLETVTASEFRGMERG